MKIEDAEIVELVKQIEELEKKLFAHALHKVFHILLIHLSAFILWRLENALYLYINLWLRKQSI